MNTGEKIKFLREQKGYTLEELGAKIGVQKSTVRKWEIGLIANMGRDKIAKLADVFEVSPTYLVRDDHTEVEKEIVAKDDDEEVDPVILDLITKLEAAPLPVRNAAIAAALAVLSSDL